MALIKIKQINNSPASAGDVITFDGSNNVWAPTTGQPDQNLWETITADSGLTTANTTTDTLNVVGGSNVTTVIAGDTLTISAVGGGFDQNLWETITSDSGSAVANTITDTLTIAGGTNISTSVSGDTLTITNDAPNIAQNLWETITADSGSTTANTTTDTLNILGTSSEIVTSVVSDTMFIGLEDNIIVPGTESITIPAGTTAQRPVTPITGMLRFNITLNCTEEYDGTDWTCLRTQNTLVGGLYQMIFSVNGIIKNAWMDQGADNVSSNSTMAVTLAKSKVVAYTYTNARTGVSVDLELYSTPEGVSPTVTQTLEDTWSLASMRTARKSNFPTDIIFEAGDKIGVFSNDVGGTTPNDAIFILFLQYLEENDEEVTSNVSGNMSA